MVTYLNHGGARRRTNPSQQGHPQSIDGVVMGPRREVVPDSRTGADLEYASAIAPTESGPLRRRYPLGYTSQEG